MASSRGRFSKSGTLTHEQMQALGILGAKDMTQVLTVPPPTYPPLKNKPRKIELTEDLKDRIKTNDKLKKKFRSEEYSEQLDRIIDWKRFPRELRPGGLKTAVKRKREAKSPSTIVKKEQETKDLQACLKILEEKEKIEESEAKTDELDDDDDQQEEEVAEDEADDDNDYENSYFDNGESYNDEDDNLDDDFLTAKLLK